MNVLIMTDKLDTGGAETYFCKLENRLSHPRFIFYTAAASGDLLGKLKHKERYITLSRKNHLANVIKLMKVIKEKKIDVIHANSLRMALYAIVIQNVMTKDVQIIYTKHNVTILEKKMKRMFSRLLNRQIARIITVSKFEKDNLVKLGVAETRITTIYNGVDLEQFNFKGKQKGSVRNIGILARLSQEKNVELFIKVAHALRDSPHFIFHIAGDGPEKNKLQKMICDMDLAHKVKMHGEISDPERFIHQMDLLLLTSLREVFPMVVLEAMAVGTPLISIDTGGIKEAVIHNKTGLLAEDYSVREFVEKINSLAESQTLRTELAAIARKQVEQQFASTKMIERTLNEYIGLHGKGGITVERKKNQAIWNHR